MDISTISLNGGNLGSSLMDILLADEIKPGDTPGYELCKQIYLYHPLGGKMVDSPIKMAQSQTREISIPDSPEDVIKEAFIKEWKALEADKHIANATRISRIYGASSLVLGAEGVEPSQKIEPLNLHKLNIYFNVFDPLNTAGSMVLNQTPNNPGFQKAGPITSNGQKYHPSRSIVTMNEEPIYLSYTSSAFGYTGRSVYQRALFPLKSFIKTMLTDDMVTTKAGVLIAKMKQQGSIVDRMMSAFQGMKRQLLKEAKTSNVLSISTDEDIETLNLQNTDSAMTTSRKNIVENVAVSADMPAKILNSETFAEGFGEGTEDAKNVARFVETIRAGMEHLYIFFEKITMFRAWNPEFYATIQTQFPAEYGEVDYKTALYKWMNSFTATWPSLLIEPESERAKTEDVKLGSIIKLFAALVPHLDPENKALLVEWCADNFNDQKLLFQNPLNLNYEALKQYTPPANENGMENIFNTGDVSGNLADDNDEESLNSTAKRIVKLLKNEIVKNRNKAYSDSDFKEENHPRDEDGKFSNGSSNKKIEKTNSKNTSSIKRSRFTDKYEERAENLTIAFRKMGLEVERDSSRVSKSEYLTVKSPDYEEDERGDIVKGRLFKFRVSDHKLPDKYEKPDYDVDAGGQSNREDIGGSWTEAVKWIANKYNLDLPSTVKSIEKKEENAKNKANLKGISLNENKIKEFENIINKLNSNNGFDIKKSSSGAYTLSIGKDNFFLNKEDRKKLREKYDLSESTSREEYFQYYFKQRILFLEEENEKAK